ncbi:MAG TPA: M13 family metallopeptidase N-terminal domain-containing protein, partial [Woeseiaceae bacterium]|nr:M13 family metallopeptidase N-terminal domain-containing protein [Woeseiaceae bacterium]
MMKFCVALACAALLAGCNPASSPEASTAVDLPVQSGIDFAGMDTSVRPQDDFFAYANGTWVENTTIPPEESGWGSFNILRDNGLAQLRTIIEDVSGDTGADDAGAKIGNFYTAWLDLARATGLGVKPLEPLL